MHICTKDKESSSGYSLKALVWRGAWGDDQHKLCLPQSSALQLAGVVGKSDNLYISLEVSLPAREELQPLQEGVGRPQLRHLMQISQIMRTTNG